MQICEHTKRIGDNYGVDCQDCGERLEGFGYGGFLGRILKSQWGQRGCLHVWGKLSAKEEECQYCEERRERAQKAN
jgi:hypothetical protein